MPCLLTFDGVVGFVSRVRALGELGQDFLGRFAQPGGGPQRSHW